MTETEGRNAMRDPRETEREMDAREEVPPPRVRARRAGEETDR